MNRQPPRFGPKLEALMDERDHLLVTVSLERDRSSSDPDKLEALHRKVIQLENQIKRDWGELHAERPGD